jgi:hypothetical protein
MPFVVYAGELATAWAALRMWLVTACGREIMIMYDWSEL